MESWGVTKDDAIWATEDEYTRWNKKSRLNSNSTSNSNSNSNSTSKAIGRMFYKTKLCCKYRSGTCPYVTNCNFAHGLDELRNPPENWQEIVAAHDEEQHQNQNHNSNNNNNNNHSEQHLQQIPIISTTESRGESHHSQRSYKGRHCKKFYTQEGCPYGDSCTFLHDEQSRSRESVAISVTPALAPPSAVAVGGASASSSSVNVNSVKPSNWKTRICNKWETTGTCPFGPKCHFAHGWPELHNFGGGTTEGDCRESPAATETKTAAGMAIKTDAAPTASLEHHHHNHHHVGGGITSQRPSMVIKVVGRRPHPKWKGPDKISRIYGDWIGDIE